MSWESHYHPTAEAMEKYKPWQYGEKFYKDETESHVREAELELLVYCLEDHSNDSTHSVIQSLSFMLRYLANTIQANEVAFAYDRWVKENGDLWYSGRNFDQAYESIEEIIDKELTMFVLFAKVIKTDSYFDPKSKFYEKKHEIIDCIGEFKEQVGNRVIHEITNDLKDFYEDPYAELKEELTN